VRVNHDEGSTEQIGAECHEALLVRLWIGHRKRERVVKDAYRVGEPPSQGIIGAAAGEY